MKCCICKNEIVKDPISGCDQGNNARPVAFGRCCDSCNNTTVIPTRLILSRKQKSNEEKEWTKELLK